MFEAIVSVSISHTESYWLGGSKSLLTWPLFQVTSKISIYRNDLVWPSPSCKKIFAASKSFHPQQSWFDLDIRVTVAFEESLLDNTNWVRCKLQPAGYIGQHAGNLNLFDNQRCDSFWHCPAVKLDYTWCYLILMLHLFKFKNLT